MPNYRGGDIQQSTYNAELVKAIKAGQTAGQKRRDLIKKIAGAVITTGLQATAAEVKRADSVDKQRASEAKQDAADREEYANSPTKNYVSNPKIVDRSPGPSWLTEGGVGYAGGIQRNDESYDDPGNDRSPGTVNPDGSVNHGPIEMAAAAEDKAGIISMPRRTYGPGGSISNNDYAPQGTGMRGSKKVWQR